MFDLPFTIRALVGTGDLVSFIAERDGKQLAIVKYMIGNVKRRASTAEAWVNDERLCGKLSAKMRGRMKSAIEGELQAAELRARKELDERAEAENQAQLLEAEESL